MEASSSVEPLLYCWKPLQSPRIMITESVRAKSFCSQRLVVCLFTLVFGKAVLQV